MDWGVVYEVPNTLADEAILHFVDLGGFDDFLLVSSGEPPVDHVTRALFVVCGNDEARVVRAQARCKHSCAPRPPSRLEARKPGCFILPWPHFGEPAAGAPAVLEGVMRSRFMTAWRACSSPGYEIFGMG